MSKATLSDVVTGYKDTGPCEIDCDAVASLWGSLWSLVQTNDSFRLLKYRRKNSASLSIKVAISDTHAQELICRLNLSRIQHPAFKSSASWRSINTN